MTTESKDTRSSGPRVLLGTAAATAALGAVTTVVALASAGRPAGAGAAVGSLLVLAVLGLGTLVVDTTARVLPAAALLVAVLTYTLQVVLMALVLVGLSRSGLLDRSIDRHWLAGTVIAGTLAWTAVQLVRTTRLRLPAFEGSAGDLGDGSTTATAPPVAAVPAGGSDRRQAGER